MYLISFQLYASWQCHFPCKWISTTHVCKWACLHQGGQVGLCFLKQVVKLHVGLILQVVQLARVGIHLHSPKKIRFSSLHPQPTSACIPNLRLPTQSACVAVASPVAICLCLPKFYLPLSACRNSYLRPACIPYRRFLCCSACIPCRRFSLRPLTQILPSSSNVLPALPTFPNRNLDVSATTMGDVSHSPTKFGDALITMYRRNLDLIYHKSISFSHFVPWHSRDMPSLKLWPCGPWHYVNK